MNEEAYRTQIEAEIDSLINEDNERLIKDQVESNETRSSFENILSSVNRSNSSNEASNLIVNYDNQLTDYSSSTNEDTMTNDQNVSLKCLNSTNFKSFLNDTSNCITKLQNTASKPANVDTNEKNSFTKTETSFLENVLEQQRSESPTSLVQSSSIELLNSSNNDLLNNETTTVVNNTDLIRTVLASTNTESSTLDTTRQGVNSGKTHLEISELVEQEECSLLKSSSSQNLDAIQNILNSTTSGNRILGNLNTKTVLIQNKVRSHCNSIKNLNYSANQEPDQNKEQRDFIDCEKVSSSYCTSVINLKNNSKTNQSEQNLQKEQVNFESTNDQIKTTSANLINFIHSTSNDDSNGLTKIDRTSSDKNPDVFNNYSFLDCPNLVVNCELDGTQNSGAFLTNPSNLVNSNLLLTTVDSDLINEPINNSDSLIKTAEQSNVLNQSSQIIQLSSQAQLNKNQNNLLTTVLFVSDSNLATQNSNEATTGVNSFDTNVSTSEAFKNSTASTLLISDSQTPELTRQLTTTSLPINARVLVIENLAQLSELTSGQNLIFTTTPLLQKTNSIDLNKEKICEPSSVISHCSTPSLTTKKRVLNTLNKKGLLKRQFAIDDNEINSETNKNSNKTSKPKSDHVLVIKELNTVDNCLNSELDSITIAKNKESNKSDKKSADKMLDASDFRGVLNAAQLAAAVAEHQSTYQSLNGRLTPPGYGQQLSSTAQSQLAASQQYATLQPLPPISTMSDKFDKFTHHYVLNGGNHSNSSPSAGNHQSVIGATNCASNSVHPGFTLMPNTTLGKIISFRYLLNFFVTLARTKLK